jgi:hypothetical protein
MNKIFEKYGFTIAAIALSLILVVFSGISYLNRNSSGVIDGMDGTALYLKGEGCTVNYDKNREAFKAKLDWCLQQHDIEASSGAIR